MFKRILKWLGVAAATVVALALLGVVVVYAISERAIRSTRDVPLHGVAIPTDSLSLQRGERLATIYGCNSCHGKNLEGSEVYDEPGIAKINAPNLTRVVLEYTNPELERLIRHGVKRDGTTTWMMPSAMFSHLSDEDLGEVIAFVRSRPVLDGPMRETIVRPLGRLGIVLGKFKPMASQIDPTLVHPTTTDRTSELAYGRYLVMTACTECHGAELGGSDVAKAPSLIVAMGYGAEDFQRLLHTGVAIGGRTLGLMTETAKSRFPALSDEEIGAIRVYLDQRFAAH